MHSIAAPRLLVLTQTHNIWGGIESRMADLFPAMTAAGWDVQYALASGRRYNIPGVFKKRHHYIRDHHILDGQVGTPDRRQRSIVGILNRLDPDVVMPIAIGDAIPAIRRFKDRGGNARLVIPVHSSHAGTLADIVSNTDIIDAVGVVSGLVYQWAKEVLSPPLEVHWIKNGVLRAYRPRVQNASNVLRVGFVGRLEPDLKRVFDLVTVLDALRAANERISLTVAGEGPSDEALLQEFTQFARFHELRALGFLPRERLYQEIYPELDCILLTSKREGSPLVLIEAMQHGVVPVSSRFHGHASEGLLSPGRNSLTFPVGDGAAAAAALIRLAHDKALLVRLGEEAKRTAASYTRDGMMNGWIEACSRALEKGTRMPAVHPPNSDRNYGRLDRLGMPGVLADTIRRLIGTKFNHGSGFDEWPGSLNTDTKLEAQICKKLSDIEKLNTDTLYH